MDENKKNVQENQIDPTKMILEGVKYSNIFQGYLALIFEVIVLFAFSYVLIKFRADWRFTALVIFFLILVIWMSVYRIKKLKNINTRPSIIGNSNSSNISESSYMEGDEKILSGIYGIIYGGWQVHKEILSIGEYAHPENALFITNHGIIVAAVPIAGVGLSINKIDFSTMGSVMSKGQIEDIGKKMIETMTPAQILSNHKSNYYIPFNQLTEVRFYGLFSKSGISFVMNNGKKYKYLLAQFQYKEQSNEIKSILANHVSVRITSGFF